jgi:ketosteroid isomerase-like protein
MSTDDVGVLLDLNRSYVRAAQESDATWYAENLADDFLSSRPDGVLEDKREFLARIARPQPARDMRPVDPRVRILGDVALVHSGFAFRKPDGRPGTGRYTDIYVKRGGRWLCVSAHFNVRETVP